jgi:uncharacterized repeat protein (TIGR03803 family)
LNGLTVNAAGDLFGTTEGGGASGAGTVFEIQLTIAPTIPGTQSGQTTTSEATVKPFSAVAISDANSGATDTLTITLGGAGGTLTDGTGFHGLTSSASGVYTLTGAASAITSELDALSFAPTAGAPTPPRRRRSR